MLFGDIPLVDMLKQRMRWHQDRQKVLAENVAQAETPGYRARDLKPPEFTPSAQAVGGPVTLAVTEPGHLPGRRGGGPQASPARTYEVTPEGNAVVLEEEMLRISQNVMDFQAVSQLYGRGLGMLRTAIGRRA